MSAQHNIGDLNAALAEYQRLRKMSVADVLSKQGGKLGREIFHQLLAIAPEPGAIRQEVFARLLSGRGIKIRQAAYEKNEMKMLRHYVKRFGYRPGGRKRRSDAKKLNYQNELVKREIGVRESGRRILAISARHPKTLPEQSRAISRDSQLLSMAGVKLVNEGGIARFDWSSLSKQGQSAAAGIGRARAQAAIQQAINIVRDDIVVYTRRKHVETATKAVRKMVTNKWSQSALKAEIKRVMAGA